MSNEAKIKITADSNSAIQNIEKLFAAILKIGEDAKLSSEQMNALASVLNATKEVFVALDGVIQSNTDNIKTNKEENRKLTEEEKKAEVQKERLKQAIQNLAAGMGGSIGQFVSFIYQLKEASKEGSKTEVALLAVTGVMSLLHSGVSRVTEAIRGNAEEGDRYSQAIIGSQKHIENSVDDLIAAFTKGLAPAIAGIASVISPLIDLFSEYVRESNAANVIGFAFAKTLSMSITVVHALSVAYGKYNEILLDHRYAIHGATDAEMRQMAIQRDKEKKAEESYQNIRKQIDLMLENVEKGGQAAEALIDKEIYNGKKGADFILELNSKLTDSEASSHAERIKIIEDYQKRNEYALSNMESTRKAIEKKRLSEVRAAQKEELDERKQFEKDREEEAKKQSDKNIEDFQAEMDLRLSMLDGSKQAELELLLQYQSTFNALHEDDLNAQMGYQQKINETVDQANIEREEKEMKTEADRLERNEATRQQEIEGKKTANEIYQSLVEDRIASIDAESSSEAEASNKKIKLYQAVSKSALASAALRKKVELDLLTEQKKINTQHEKQYVDYAKKVSSTVSGALNQMIFEHKSFNEVVGGLIKEFAMKAVATFVEMAATAVAKDIAVAGSAVATSAAKKAAQSATVPSAIAAWTAGIPVIGPSVYSTYLALFKSLMASGEAVMGHEEGGPTGRVPGFGRSDSFGYTDKVNSQEFILNERGRKAFGDEALSYANETGSNPFGSGQGSGDPDRILGTIKVVVEHRNMLTPADDVARAVAPAITKAISQYVVFNDGTLIASKLK